MEKDSLNYIANRKNAPLDKKGFDEWADSYDLDVKISDEDKEYPFEAYSDVVSGVIRLVKAQPGTRILDCGIEIGRAHV